MEVALADHEGVAGAPGDVRNTDHAPLEKDAGALCWGQVIFAVSWVHPPGGIIALNQIIGPLSVFVAILVARVGAIVGPGQDGGRGYPAGFAVLILADNVGETAALVRPPRPPRRADLSLDDKAHDIVCRVLP